MIIPRFVCKEETPTSARDQVPGARGMACHDEPFLAWLVTMNEARDGPP
jgi:hypothetical protein